MSPEVVREQLQRVLASELFSSAGRHSRLLRHLVERTLAGGGDQLKEYALATEVFDRPDSYDPRLDSIVRVEARRLRSRLEDYYRGPGASDPIVITIPRGSYVPTFAPSGPPAADTTGPLAAPGATTAAPAVRTLSPGRPVRSLAVLGIAAAAVAGLLGTWLLNVDRSPAAEASPKPSIAVLPFEHYSTSEQDAAFAAYLTDSLTTSLARLGTVSVASRTSASQYTGHARSVVEIAKALNVRLVTESTVTIAGDEIRLAIRLVDGAHDRKVWVREYRTTRRELSAVLPVIAQEAADNAHRYLAR
jgi:TolB-like protein